MSQVFWTVGQVLGAPPSAKGGGDFIADAAAMPPLPHAALRPSPGVYVRGIWVRAPKLDGCVMSFFGQRLDVSGRDRYRTSTSLFSSLKEKKNPRRNQETE